MITLALTGLILLFALPPLVERGLRRAGRVEANFRGERIPQSFGLVILLWAGLMLPITAFLFPAGWRMDLLWLCGVLGFGMLGWIDDVWGTKRIKGLKGHFRAALRERTYTTGFVKAVGGAILALCLGYGVSALSSSGFAYIAPSGLAAALIVVLNGGLIALCANAVNLLDLRPGRAGGAFLLIGMPLWAASLYAGAASAVPFALVLLPALVVWRLDSHARVMMGDTGSNLLGAVLGLALCASWVPIAARVATLIGLLALHVLAERVSLTRLIAENRVLRTLDRLSGVR